MGLVQCGVAVLAIGTRFLAAGWFLIFAMLTLGIVPILLTGPLVLFGFVAPAEAYPLLLIADILLLTSALTLPDMGDNPEYQFPWMTLRTGCPGLSVHSSRADRLVAVGRFGGYAYLIALLALTVWTLAWAGSGRSVCGGAGRDGLFRPLLPPGLRAEIRRARAGPVRLAGYAVVTGIPRERAPLSLAEWMHWRHCWRARGRGARSCCGRC